MRNFKFFIYIWLSLIIFIPGTSSSQTIYEQALKFGRVLEWIDRYYVDSVNQKELVEDAIIEMLKKLDPHSSYLTKKEAEETNEPLQGNFEGIGISFNILYDTIFIISPISGGPSEKVGILAGDRIVKVDGINVAGIGITNEDVYRLLRGEKNTKVTVTILRRYVNELLDFTITRDKIPIYSIDASYKVKDDIGYIKINRFSMTTIVEFIEAVEKLKSQNVNNLILDLSGNGGGYLDIAVKLADQFLNNEKLIVYTEGINNPRREYLSTLKGVFETGNIVIIIDEGSASASEIVAGAIQDWDRGIIIGRRSFGKGLVQRPLKLPDSSMVRLTVARYYTPTGRLIQKPYDMSKSEYDNDIINRYNNGELSHKDSIHFPDSLKYNTLKNSRIVYGGGGIMPDFFIPIDTSFYSDYYRDLLRRGILNRFTLKYIENNRTRFESRYLTFNDFKINFEVTDKLLNELIEFANKEDLFKDKEAIEISGEKIKLLIKAYIARDLWSSSEFYEIMNENEVKYQKAIDILDNWKYYETLLMKKI
jgi:carboxyl-terminal processing protease